MSHPWSGQVYVKESFEEIVKMLRGYIKSIDIKVYELPIELRNAMDSHTGVLSITEDFKSE